MEVDAKIVGAISKGMLVLVGFEEGDGEEDIRWMCGKLSKLRIFDDEQGLMNLSITDVGGDFLVVSQFTLHAKTKKGNRPSFIQAATPEVAIPLYNQFVSMLKEESDVDVQKGVFGAQMTVSLENDGPVTLFMDTKNKE